MAALPETIIDFIRRNGPSTAVEVAQGVSSNSIIVSAVLVDCESKHQLKKSSRKVGSLKLYYLPEQRGQLDKRIQNLLTPEDKGMLQKMLDWQVIAEFEVNQPDLSLLLNLEDFIDPIAVNYEQYMIKGWKVPSIGEDKAKEIILNRVLEVVKKAEAEKAKSAPKPEPAPEPKPAEPKPLEEPPKAEEKVEEKAKEVEQVAAEVKKIEPQKPEVVREEKKPKPKKEEQKTLTDIKAQESSFRNDVLEWLEKKDIDVEKEVVIKDGKEFELRAKLPNPFGKQTCMIRIIENAKATASQGDVSTIGMDAVARRIPAIIVCNTGFSKTATKYWKKELQDIVTLVSKDDLE